MEHLQSEEPFSSDPNFSTGLKSGGTPGVALGVEGVYCSMWELRMGSGPR